MDVSTCPCQIEGGTTPHRGGGSAVEKVFMVFSYHFFRWALYMLQGFKVIVREVSIEISFLECLHVFQDFALTFVSDGNSKVVVQYGGQTFMESPFPRFMRIWLMLRSRV